MRTLFRCLQLSIFAVFVAATAPTVVQAQDPVVVYLVRHGERANDDPRDPNLSDEGHERARRLAMMLADAGIDHIHSTDLRRTRQTAAPLAERLGLEVALYNPRDLAAVAAQLRATPGRHLVSGHSNTTPALVEALGGDSHGEITEDEYTRLYIVVIAADGAVETVLLRF